MLGRNAEPRDEPEPLPSRLGENARHGFARFQSTARPTTPPDNVWDRYQPWRHTVEWGFWIVSYLVGAIASSVTVLMDVRRLHLDFEGWEPAVWEWSSHLVSLALIPAVLWFTRRFPMHFDTWRRNLPWHVLGSVAWSALHVVGMVGLRKLVYAVQGYHYDFGPWRPSSYTSTSRTSGISRGWSC